MISPKKSTVKWVKDGIFDTPYWVGVCTTERQYKHETKRLQVSDGDAGEWLSYSSAAKTHFFVNKNTGHHCCLVCIPKPTEESPMGIVSSLVHEAVHIWQKTAELIGEDHPSDEFEAYCIQGISENLMKAYGPYRQKKKGGKKKGCK